MFFLRKTEQIQILVGLFRRLWLTLQQMYVVDRMLYL